jgi:hypothetical protein
MEAEEIIELELSTGELVDAALEINYVQGFDLNVDMHSVDGMMLLHLQYSLVMLNVMHHCCHISY